MKTLKRYLKLIFLFAKFSLMSQLEYRINFVAGIAVETGYLVAKLLYVVVVYQAGSEIAGMTPDNITMFIGTYTFMTGIYMLFYPNLCAIPSYVREGNLDMLITKPVSLQFITTLKNLDFALLIPDALAGIVLICIGWHNSNIPVTAVNIIGFITFLFSGAFLTYSLFLIPKLLSFWFVSDRGIAQITEALWDFNNMSMNIYGKWIQRIGTFVIPIFVITNFSTLFVMEKLNLFYIIWGLIVPIIVFIISKLIWNRAIKHYTSASS